MESGKMVSEGRASQRTSSGSGTHSESNRFYHLMKFDFISYYSVIQLSNLQQYPPLLIIIYQSLASAKQSKSY